MDQLFIDLNTHRVEHDWTWHQLADAMATAGVPFSPRTLHYLCKRQPEDACARDRTLHRIRKYLAHVRAAAAAAAEADQRTADRRARRARRARAAREVTP